MDYVFFKTLASIEPWRSLGFVVAVRKVWVMYNPRTKVLVAQLFEEIEDTGVVKAIAHPTCALVDDPCKVFDLIAHEQKKGRLQDVELLTEEELAEVSDHYSNMMEETLNK